MQSAGGANAGAVGGAMLRAARTRNIGSGQAAISQASQHAGENLSQRTAELQSKNADLQQKQRAQALSGLGDLYGENVNAGEKALGLSNQSLEEAGNLKNFWQDLLSQSMGDAAKVGAAYAGAG